MSIAIIYHVFPSIQQIHDVQVVATSLVLIALGLAAVAILVNKALNGIKRVLTEHEPEIDDVTGRRRVRAERFAALRRELAAAALGRRR